MNVNLLREWRGWHGWQIPHLQLDSQRVEGSKQLQALLATCLTIMVIANPKATGTPNHQMVELQKNPSESVCRHRQTLIPSQFPRQIDHVCAV